MTQTPPNYISFEAPKERHGRKMLATQESLSNIHPNNLPQTMAPPILDQAAHELLPRLQQVAASSGPTVTAEQTAMQV